MARYYMGTKVYSTGKQWGTKTLLCIFAAASAVGVGYYNREPIMNAAIAYADAVNESDRQELNSILAGQNLHDIRSLGRNYWNIGEDDLYGIEFRAKNLANQNVHGIVCKGWLKASTVRYLP